MFVGREEKGDWIPAPAPDFDPGFAGMTSDGRGNDVNAGKGGEREGERSGEIEQLSWSDHGRNTAPHHRRNQSRPGVLLWTLLFFFGLGQELCLNQNSGNRQDQENDDVHRLLQG